MKRNLITTFLFALALTAGAQSATDPILMHINGKPITRSEFEYSFHKNGSIEGAVEKKNGGGVRAYVYQLQTKGSCCRSC